MKALLYLTSVLLIASCTTSIKGEKSAKEGPGIPAENMVYIKEVAPVATPNVVIENSEDLLGYWVGGFEPAVDSLVEYIAASEMLLGTNSNMINISLDRIEGDSVFGHSVVANNFRPFVGTVEDLNGEYVFKAVEPGDHQHDGVFSFSIGPGDSLLIGEWEAFGNLKIKNRKYSLKKYNFNYDASNTLLKYQPFVDWEKRKYSTEKLHIDSVTIEEAVLYFINYVRADSLLLDSLLQHEDERLRIKQNYVDWTNQERDYYASFYSTTEAIHKHNASADTLTGEIVENLSKADIYVLRNSIYARHGYSFKNKQLRKFFEQQPWYAPVISDIKSELTELEKQNIQMLLKYEEHAEEYYDYFGRG